MINTMQSIFYRISRRHESFPGVMSHPPSPTEADHTGLTEVSNSVETLIDLPSAPAPTPASLSGLDLDTSREPNQNEEGI